MRTDRPAPGYADREPTQPPDWHGLVVWDFFCNALTTGLFLGTALAELAAPTVFSRSVVWAYPLALLLLLIDLVLLVLDLGDPLRFHHMLRVFKPSSPMSLGTWFLSAYALPLTAVVVLELLPVDGWVRVLLLIVGLPLAFGSAAYKGVLFSTTAQPGWRDARWLGAYHTSSAVALGCAVLLVLAEAIGPERAATVLRVALGVLVVVNLVPLGLLAVELRPTLERVHSRRWLGWVGGLVFGGGVVVPVVLLLVGGWAAVVAAGLVMAAGLGVRSVVVRLPHASAPPFNREAQPSAGVSRSAARRG